MKALSPLAAGFSALLLASLPVLAADSPGGSSTGQVIDYAKPGEAAAPKTAAPGAATSTTTDKPALGAPAAGAAVGSAKVEPSPASPTGATTNMAPIRGTATPPLDTSSASGMTKPGASSGSSLGTGSNGTIKDPSHPVKEAK